MKKIYVFVLKSFVGPMVFTFFIAVFILLMQFLWKYVDDIVGKGFEWYTILQLMFYASATFVPLALPLAVLLASLMTFGNLGEHYELVAMKAAGISFRQAMFPLLLFIVLLSGMALYFSNYVLPIVNLKYGTLLFDIREKKPALNINEGVFYSELQGYVIRVGKKDKDGVTIRDVMIADHTEDMGNINVTVADSGRMETMGNKPPILVFTLYHGYNYYEPSSHPNDAITKPMQRTKFDEETRRIDLSELNMIKSKEDLFKDNYQMLNLSQLSHEKDTLVMKYVERQAQAYDYYMKSFHYFNTIDSSKYDKKLDTVKLKDVFITNFKKGEQSKFVEIALNSARSVSQQTEYIEKELDVKREVIARYNIEWNRKFTLSIACLILFFIGAPLGAIIRKGGLGLPVVFSTLLFIIFHVISMMGEKSAREGVLSAAQGMWLALWIYLPVGILLMYSATTDSKVLNLEWWNLIIKKLWKKEKKHIKP